MTLPIKVAAELIDLEVGLMRALGLAAWRRWRDDLPVPAGAIVPGLTIDASVRLRRAATVGRLVLTVAIALAGARSVSAGQTRDLPFETFRAWHRLVPEAGEVRLCGLTRAGHALWAQGQLRVPLFPGSVAMGALMPDQEL